MTTATIPRSASDAADPGSPLRRAVRWLVLGPARAPRWERPALWGLLVLSGVLYIANLSISGYANSFYSAAVQAGSTNWEAFFFGSSDAANSITVDKPPASLWIMELSVRLFGLSSWSILLPEALMGVATVFLVHRIVRRHFSAGAALLAGGALALTPVAVMMFRFNNPDALLLLLMTLAVAFTLRGIESGRIRWVIWAGVAVGFGFLTKQLQAFVILPELAVVYFFCAPPLARAPGPPPRGGRRGRRGRRMVGRDRFALAGVVASLHRRLPEQLVPRTHLRVQRLRSAHRQRDR
ncbi:hypothetical protein GCM10025867_21930 [Frondihabitans sucicola]|uniref:Glycosyltransferase RgtA/B/C/D-like domain-containing protein n=1 Tax=Frondihabitans sucicola TaxID=1268041 RepID=A0ABM8GNY4_9MICO|nr:glycosyltransferase family 39 protein [Frondihabitans sucicola]BDZ49952.1 hypothetical protein GCM10025867_21930 [Frondihabitans sucicola]